MQAELSAALQGLQDMSVQRSLGPTATAVTVPFNWVQFWQPAEGTRSHLPAGLIAGKELCIPLSLWSSSSPEVFLQGGRGVTRRSSLKQCSATVMVFFLARASCPGKGMPQVDPGALHSWGICDSLIHLSKGDCNEAKFTPCPPLLALSVVMCTLQLGPTTITPGPIHHARSRAGNNDASTGKLKSAETFQGAEISPCLSVLRLGSHLGPQGAQASSQHRCQLCSFAPHPRRSRKPALSSGAHSWHTELKGAWKAEINPWHRRVWHSSAIKSVGYKKHRVVWLFCGWAQRAGFLRRGNWNAVAFWCHDSLFYNSV